MFTLFQSKEKEMETLDEKQIQERLYGRYHRGSISSQVAAPTQKQQNVAVSAEKTVKQEITPQAYREVSGGAFDIMIGVLRHIPWKFVGIVAGAFVTTLLLVNMIAYLFGKMKVDSEDGQKSGHVQSVQVEKSDVKQSTAVNQIVPIQKVKLPEGMSSASSVKTEKVPESNTLTLNPAQVSSGMGADSKASENVTKQKFYAVQICTYQRETDAKTLVNELNQKGFKAFIKETHSQQRDFYVVFLERSKSYTDAKNTLNRFKASDLSSQFQDAFIRSI